MLSSLYGDFVSFYPACIASFNLSILSSFIHTGAQDGELELTGGEDSIVLNAVIATLPPVVAYREGNY